MTFASSAFSPRSSPFEPFAIFAFKPNHTTPAKAPYHPPVQLYSILVITVILPYAVRYVFMIRLGLNELTYIMLSIYALSLFTIGYPLVGAFSLIHVTYLFLMDYLTLN